MRYKSICFILLYIYPIFWQRNAVLLAKSRQAKSISGNNANLTEAVDNGQSLEETVKRIKQDQKKFMYFWEGVKNGVNAHELKKKHERQSTKLEHHEVSITVCF